ncbi:MAG: PKD domain-containing protein, partial [Bacteroidales bacterium]|nr:PKD domain-containing protein [Bacteroidales bacterium]
MSELTTDDLASPAIEPIDTRYLQLTNTVAIMKRIAMFVCLLILLIEPVTARNRRDTIGVGGRVSFTENKGQWAPQVRYKAQMRQASLFLEENCFTLVLQHPDNENLQHPSNTQKGKGRRYRQHAYKVHFVGCETSGMQGEEQEKSYSNYFLGSDPARWASFVPDFATVRYVGLYEGVDLRVYSAENALKYDFIVAPKANANQIVMRYEGVDNLRLQDGNIIVGTSVLDVVELKPYAYQRVHGKVVPVEAEYVLKGNEVRIVLGKYDPELELVVDPYLYFSTYTGSHSDNWGASGCYDSHKNTYTAGLVFGTEYPVSLGSYDGSFNGNADIGIFKFDTSGSQRLFATYLGGTHADMPHSLFVNSFDELILMGTTGSDNFPTTPNAYSATFSGGRAVEYEGGGAIVFPNGSDMFVARLSQDGSQLLASTYVGGTGNDGLNYFPHFNSSYDIIMGGNDSLYFNYGDGARGELITDDLNNVYVGSTTMSADFPTTPGCLQSASGGRQDGVVYKLDHNLSHLLWSTYLGGIGNDAVYSIDVDRNYNLLVTGGTNSINLPCTPGSINPAFTGGGADGFVAKISRHGTQLMACTYFGSSYYDQSYFVRCGKNDDVFIFGQTKCPNGGFIRNATYNVPGAGQFLARLTPHLDSIVWSTTFGSMRHEPDISPTAFAVDICNRVYLCGWGRYFLGYRIGGETIGVRTRGTTGLPVTHDAYQSETDGQDFYIMCLAADASQIEYASYFGEQYVPDSSYMGHDHVDGGTSRFDRLATLYESVCSSCGGYNSFPTTPNAWSRTNNSNNCNNAIFRFNVKDDFPVAEFRIPKAGCAPLTTFFENTGRGDSFFWDFGDGTTSTLENPSHTYAIPGSYTVTLVARLSGGCHETDTLRRVLMVLGKQAYSLDTLSTCNGLRLQIGLNPSIGCTYRWIHGSVSDSTIANPYIDGSGTYTLVVSSEGCADTLTQVVRLGYVNLSIIGDTVTCVSPSTYRMDTEGTLVSQIWSSHGDLSDTLGRGVAFVYPLQRSGWLYAHVEDQLGCMGDDSIFVHFNSICDSLVLNDPTCH